MVPGFWDLLLNSANFLSRLSFSTRTDHEGYTIAIF